MRLGTYYNTGGNPCTLSDLWYNKFLSNNDPRPGPGGRKDRYMIAYFLAGCALWGCVVLALYALRAGSPLHAAPVEMTGRSRALVLAVLCATVLVCVLPMGLSPIWNGQEPGHRNQYEVMAESLLKGHLYMDYDDVDPRLLTMANPYDPQLRDALGLHYHWDHAFYNGHYYMYFGIVPVLLLFLPYRLITGTSLITYHATQLFTTLFICGVFALFYRLSRRFFRRAGLGVYLAMSAAFSLMGTWYFSEAPALYCTAISAGVCFMIWSVYLFVRAVWGEMTEKKSILLAFAGSLTGALAFGCRPPVALANVLVLPLLVEYLRGRKFTWKLVGQLFFAASPYILVGVALMLYNYLRFDNPFEFGQSYQLTVSDLSGGNGPTVRPSPNRPAALWDYFFFAAPCTADFPFIPFNGALLKFPVTLCGAACLLYAPVRRALRNKRLAGLTAGLFAAALLIAVADVIGSPDLFERYRSDDYWLLGILSFLLLSSLCCEVPEAKRRFVCTGISVLAVFTVITCFLAWCIPNDQNLTEVCPEILTCISHVFFLGLR